ncbi:MAG: NADH-quinone oxidoreductase subunit C [Leptospiraceae bacterium]|nr:NADH-quinone oxidoreductase subunit C [Leptospiraceae bacterium]MCP5511585.1 NADH-quinone oxidoreductase subunit C [Leptospiraceae bacterium]
MKETLENFINQNLKQYLYKEDKVQSNLPTFYIKAEGIVEVVRALKEDPNLQFDFLNDLTAIDWLGKKEPRFEVCYLLKSVKNKHAKMMLKVPIEEGETIPSLVSIFKGANWPEREVFDMFGIEFSNHPYMERILLPDNFQGHPLRKDYPLEGFGQDYLISDLLQIHQGDKES